MNEEDIEWFKKQEENERIYNKFYKNPVSFVWISILYVNNYEVVDIIRKKHPICNSILYYDEIDSFISRHRMFRGTKYKLCSMAKFNVTISPQQILTHDYSSDYFIQLNNLQHVSFHDTISYFHEDNELFIVLSPQTNMLSTRRCKMICDKRTRRINIKK